MCTESCHTSPRYHTATAEGLTDPYMSYCWLLWLGGSRDGGVAASSEPDGGAVATLGLPVQELASWAAGWSVAAAPEALSKEGGGMLLPSSLGALLLGVLLSLRFSVGGTTISEAEGGSGWVSEGVSAGTASSGNKKRTEEQRGCQISVGAHLKKKKKSFSLWLIVIHLQKAVVTAMFIP